MSIRYVTIQEFSEFHQADIHLIEEIIHFGLVEPLEKEDQPCIREEDIEQLEAMVRLHSELDINLPGLETIMYMRRRMQELQDRLDELERRLRWYEERFAGRPSPPLWFEKQPQ